MPSNFSVVLEPLYLFYQVSGPTIVFHLLPCNLLCAFSSHLEHYLPFDPDLFFNVLQLWIICHICQSRDCRGSLHTEAKAGKSLVNPVHLLVALLEMIFR
jgi:hypothetical protein